MPWIPGDVVALRDVWFGAVWRAVAGIVLEDTPSRTVFWAPAGTASAFAADEGGKEIRMPRTDFHRAFRKTKRPMVVVCDKGAPWTLWLFFRRPGVLAHWYVNFEAYLGRSAVAYDSIDHKLDLIVHTDGRLVWKDEDELEQAGRLGLVDVAAVRRDAAAAVASPPWPTGWETYAPDPGWPAPELPEGWDLL